jgi:hypothetical protein
VSEDLKARRAISLAAYQVEQLRFSASIAGVCLEALPYHPFHLSGDSPSNAKVIGYFAYCHRQKLLVFTGVWRVVVEPRYTEKLGITCSYSVDHQLGPVDNEKQRSFFTGGDETTMANLHPSVTRAVYQILRSAKSCFEDGTAVPGLILLYSGIDIVAGLATDSPDGRNEMRKNFVKWTNRYIIPQKTLPCTAEELYGARCGLVHGYTPISDMSRKGRARQIYYAHGKSDVAKLTELISLGEMTDRVAIHTDQLLGAVREGMVRFLEAAKYDERLTKRINDRGPKIFESMGDDEADSLIDCGKRIRAAELP